MEDKKNLAKPGITKHRATRLIIAFLMFWVPVIVFSKLAGEIVENEPLGLDASILHWIHSWSNAGYDSFFLMITTVGNAGIIIPITLFISIYLFYKSHRMDSVIVLFSVGGAAVANVILKLLFHRDRPSFWHSLITETGYSFPSGHAMLSSALILSIMCSITWRTRWRWHSLVLGMIIIGLIGVSRLYLGVHYPTDIVAGWSVSLVWVVIVYILVKESSFKLAWQEREQNS